MAAKHFDSFGIAMPTEEAARSANEEVLRIEAEQRAQDARRDALIGIRGGQEMACRQAEKDAKADFRGFLGSSTAVPPRRSPHRTQRLR